MPILYTAAFDLTVVDFSLTLASSGKTTFYVKHTGSGESNTYYLTDYDANSANLYSHFDIHLMDMHDRTTSPLASTYADDPLGDILEEALNAGATGESWGGTFTVSFSATTGYYTISHSTLDFSISGNSATLNLLGYIIPKSADNPQTSIAVSSHCVLSTLDHLSRLSDEYESRNVASLSISDGGYPTGISRTTPLIYMDWYQQFETHANTHKRKAAYEDSYQMPWAFQHFFEHCRTIYPFIVYTQDLWTGFYPVFLLREEGANFHPERDHPDYDNHWHIPFKTYLYGWFDA